MRDKPNPVELKELSQVDPCPEGWMAMENPQFSICEVLREIWQETKNPKIKILSRVGLTMAKKMNHKLMDYANDKVGMPWEYKTDKTRDMLNDLI